MSIKLRFIEAAISAFNRVYPQDGLKEHKLYWSDRLNQLAAFLGLPHRKMYKVHKQTVKQLAYDFIGLQEGVSRAKKWVNRFLIPFVFLFNLVNLFFQTALSIVKIFTEFLPLTLSQFFAREAKKIEEDYNILGLKLDGTKRALIYLLIGLSILTHALYFIGRSITSPIEGVKKAWNLGELASESPLWARELLGAFFATLSIVCTTIAYVVLFPLLVKVALNAMTSLGINLAGTTLPQLIAWVKPVLAPIGNAFAQLASYLSLSAFINASVALEVGVAAVAAIGITVIGTPLSKLLDHFKKWWHREAPEWSQNKAAQKAGELGFGCTPGLLEKLYYQDKSLPVDIKKETHDRESKDRYFQDPSLVKIAERESKPMPFTLFGATVKKDDELLNEPASREFNPL